MKITFDEKDIPLLLSQANENTFLMAGIKQNTAKSTEGFGLPNFKRMVFKTESEIWKDQRVKDAIEKVKEYAKKKNYKIATPQQAQQAKATLMSSLSGVDAMAKGLVASLKKPKFVKVGGILVFACQATFQQASRTGSHTNSDTIASVWGGAAIPGGQIGGAGGAAGKAVLKGGGINEVKAAAKAGAFVGGMAAFTGVYILTKAITYGLSKLLYWLTNKKKMGYYDSFVPFINDKGKLIWTEFGRFLVGDIKVDELKVETVESYKVDMNAFSEEDCEECDTVEVVDEDDVAVVNNEANIGVDLSNAEDEPPTTEVILDSSDADGSETPVKDADETHVEEPPAEIPMDEEATESFEALTRKDEDELETEFNFM